MNILHFLLGLPGSGKTYFAKQHCEQYSNSCYIDLEVSKSGISTSCINQCKTKKTHIYLDAFICNANDMVEIMQRYKLAHFNISEIHIHYWEPNTQMCLKNDMFRRVLSSKIPILNTELDVLTESDYMLKFNTVITHLKFVKIVKHDVYNKPDWAVFASKFNNGNATLKSDKWCTGGNSGNYKGEYHKLGVEEPVDFTELDNLLTLICPDISYLVYKRLWNNCVKKMDLSESGYYGSWATYDQYVISMEELYNWLIANNIIESDWVSTQMMLYLNS